MNFFYSNIKQKPKVSALRRSLFWQEENVNDRPKTHTHTHAVHHHRRVNPDTAMSSNHRVHTPSRQTAQNNSLLALRTTTATTSSTTPRRTPQASRGVQQLHRAPTTTDKDWTGRANEQSSKRKTESPERQWKSERQTALVVAVPRAIRAVRQWSGKIDGLVR